MRGKNRGIYWACLALAGVGLLDFAALRYLRKSPPRPHPANSAAALLFGTRVPPPVTAAILDGSAREGSVPSITFVGYSPFHTGSLDSIQVEPPAAPKAPATPELTTGEFHWVSKFLAGR